MTKEEEKAEIRVEEYENLLRDIYEAGKLLKRTSQSDAITPKLADQIIEALESLTPAAEQISVVIANLYLKYPQILRSK